MEDVRLCGIAKALGDSNRLKIVRMLASGELCACRLLESFAITQPTLSHHMQVLISCGLVSVRTEGRWSHYSLNREVCKSFSSSISLFLDGGEA